MIYRKARREDIPFVVKMLADDARGSQRETYSEPLLPSYYEAFDRINENPSQELIVAEDANGEILGTFQISHLSYISHKGSKVMQIEAVRVRSDKRSQGIGAAMIRWAIDRAKEQGVRVVQLTTDKQRPDAKRFYERLGFVASHEGMKLKLKG